MTATSPLQPRLLSQMNERSVMRVLQTHGPASRAEVTRQLGVTAPTVSKAVASLLRSGYLEEYDAPENGRGRPAKKLRLATETAQVLGLVIDVDECRFVSAGLDGKLRQQTAERFATPSTYDSFIDTVCELIQSKFQPEGITTLGLGISMPGLIDYREQKGVLSPNVPMTDGHSPMADLKERLGIDCVQFQETHALCLAEKHYGSAQGLQDFAMIDATTGVGMGNVVGGRLLTGCSGLTGEIGHLPIGSDGSSGRICGCGRRGCLETVACDSALAWHVSNRLGRPVDIEEIIQLAQAGEISVAKEFDEVCSNLSIALAGAINLFNPSHVFIYARMFEIDPAMFEQLIDQAEPRALEPAFADCKIERARGSKREGAIAGVIEYLTDSRVESFDQTGQSVF